MHPHRLEQLVSSVPDAITPEQRARLLAHVQTSDGCRARTERVRGELRRALGGGDAGGSALDLACELDGLERVQQRVDGWLTDLVDELTRTRHSTVRGDGAHHGGGVPA